MIKILEEYRNLLGVVNNLINLLEKKGLIQPDPYKHDKKISDIAVPEEIPFLDSERSMVIGARLSDFESMLDFICNIFKFFNKCFSEFLFFRTVFFLDKFIYQFRIKRLFP